jgi:hypothetical protein
MQSTRSWMPVFVVFEPIQEVVATHPDTKGFPLPQTTGKAQDRSYRIGSAFLKKNGEIEVKLFSLPLSGRFVLRAPTPTDCMDPTAGSD